MEPGVGEGGTTLLLAIAVLLLDRGGEKLACGGVDMEDLASGEDDSGIVAPCELVLDGEVGVCC